jgi:D-serine deaminase-like pyridoxal phosphate-dependent protein
VTRVRRTAAEVERDLGELGARPHLQQALGLLGRTGSRSMLATPALIIDLDALELNLERAAHAASVAGVGLHPQAKAHKCSAIASLQLEHGADGISVATLGEAEALHAAGIDRLLVTSPLHEGLLDRVAALHRAMGAGLLVTIDHPDVVEPLAWSVSTELGVLIDLDVGLHRTGISDPEVAARTAERIESTDTLQLAGIQAYGGHWQHIADAAERRAMVAQGMDQALAMIERIEQVAPPVALRTGGGTGTFVDDCELKVLNDLQPGSYVFMDVQYAEALAGHEGHAWQQSLFVRSTVVSANHADWVTVDAGLKALATDAGDPIWAGGSAYAWFGDEHGFLSQPAQGRLHVGDQIELVPPHCDPTVDRYDAVHLVRGDTLVDLVPIDARGCSQ